MVHRLRDDLETLAREVFGLDLRYHEMKNHREIVGILLQRSGAGMTPVCVFGPCSPQLLEAIIRKGLLNSVAGWRVDAGSVLGVGPSIDLLFVSEELLNGPRSEYLATLVHELCHFIVETPVNWLEPEEDAKRAALQIRCHTRYAPNGPCDRDQYHTDQWFSMLFEATYQLHLAYPDLYPSQEAATEAALCYDRVDERFAGVTWRE